MADDAMDWHPTTPPAPHNPYSHSTYLPGGWPISPPINSNTSGVFARRRASGVIERAVKRVCAGIWTVGAFAVALPTKPVYLIVRSLRDRRRRRNESRAVARNSAQDRRTSPAQRARVAAAEQLLSTQQPTPSQQQTITPPATPPSQHNKISLHVLESEDTTKIQSPAASSVTNTETTILTPASLRSPQPDISGQVLRTGVKRARGEEEETSESLHYSTLQGYLDATAQVQQATPEPDVPFPSKRMKGSNRFDVDYKRSSTALAHRSGPPAVQVKPIGSRIEGTSSNGNLFGGWEFEAPLDVTLPPSPAQSQRLRPVPDGHLSEEEDAQSVSSKHEGGERDESDQTEEPYDERWASSLPLNVFFPEEFGLVDDSTTEQDPITTKVAATVLDESSILSDSNMIFHGGKPIALPPRIKPRLIPSYATRQAKQEPSIAKDSSPQYKIENIDSIENKHTPHETKVETNTDTQDDVLRNAQDVVKAEEDDGIKLESDSAVTNKNSAAAPSTPLKVVAEKAAADEAKTPAAKASHVELETPADKLSKLNIKEAGDNDTPKATPHSGTKTTRVTRYREALEKAQKAKLEQYEIVPITDEWDKKVRAAVRNGIPDYLGPHDLARVVPQYATRGQDNWLNDETINKYLELVATHGRKNDRPDQVRSHHTFNNFFYNNLKSKGPESVARWSKRAKIGGKNLLYVEKIFVPVNSGAHWTLAVIEPTQKRITHYNSMRGPSLGMRVCEDLRKWVAFELGKDFKDEEWTLTAVGESPQQTNSDDCGVFTITSARQIMLGYTPMSYGAAQIPTQRVRIVAELINKGLLRSTVDG